LQRHNPAPTFSIKQVDIRATRYQGRDLIEKQAGTIQATLQVMAEGRHEGWGGDGRERLLEDSSLISITAGNTAV